MLAAREGVMPELRQIGVLISPAENADAVRVCGVFTLAVREG
jgi:hypothetical protein